jgi:DNA mismatch endonuclease (patch repair protein)
LRCRADVVFTKQRIAVFVDGCFWHRCPLHGSMPKANSDYWQPKLDANVARDRRNGEALAGAGWTVLRFWAHEPIESMADSVAAFVEDRRASWAGATRRGGGAAEPRSITPL